MDPSHIHRIQTENIIQTLEEYLSSNLESTRNPSAEEYDPFDSPLVDPINEQVDLQTYSQCIFDVLTLHQSRGSKGPWDCVNPGDELQIEEEGGKRLKLQFGLSSATLIMNENDLQVQLLKRETSPFHLLQAEVLSSGFSIESTKKFGGFIEVELKLFKTGKLQFLMQIPTISDTHIYKSVEFSVCNNEKRARSHKNFDSSERSIMQDDESKKYTLPFSKEEQGIVLGASFSSNKKRHLNQIPEEFLRKKMTIKHTSF